ncbi:MAG TPA: hypothetical protein VF660_11830 [Actinomycetota bacterium]
MIRRIFFVLSFSALVAGLIVAPSAAADTVNAPTQVGQTETYSWDGTIPPGASSGDCANAPTSATQTITLQVPSGLYSSILLRSTTTVDYDGLNDVKFTVYLPDGTTKTADDNFVDAAESLTLSNPPAGDYTFAVCMFAGPAPQSFTGTFKLEALKIPPTPPAPCSKPGSKLSFTTPSYVDMNRAGGEPSIVSHPANGRLLYAAHAGTTHFYSPEAHDPDSGAFYRNYTGQVYAWYSDDRGKTWHFVDRTQPPDNTAGSGFSDPDFAIDSSGNVYLSEINLVNVAVSKSTDRGANYTLQNMFAETMTDRQWKAAGPTNVVYIVGNPSGGGTFPGDPLGHTNHTIYRSTDGGQTFSNGVSDPGGAGDLVFSMRTKRMYEPHLSGGDLQIAAFTNPLATDPQVALTPKIYTVAKGVDMLSHWPAIDVDNVGNVYITWDESGSGDRPAGVYYSFSTNGGRTWALPTRVDKPVNHVDGTDIWPWIAVGAPGRVAVAWFGNDHKLAGQDAEGAGDNDPWNVYVAQTLTGLGCGTGHTTAGFRQAKATPEPFHVGTICMGGTTCQAELIDRRLGDYFVIDIDKKGAVVAAYSDTRQGGSVSLPAFFRSNGGPSFLAPTNTNNDD